MTNNAKSAYITARDESDMALRRAAESLEQLGILGEEIRVDSDTDLLLDQAAEAVVEAQNALSEARKRLDAMLGEGEAGE